MCEEAARRCRTVHSGTEFHYRTVVLSQAFSELKQRVSGETEAHRQHVALVQSEAVNLRSTLARTSIGSLLFTVLPRSVFYSGTSAVHEANSCEVA